MIFEICSTNQEGIKEKYFDIVKNFASKIGDYYEDDGDTYIEMKIELKNFNELSQLQRALEEELIITFSTIEEKGFIEIYDDYRE